LIDAILFMRIHVIIHTIPINVTAGIILRRGKNEIAVRFKTITKYGTNTGILNAVILILSFLLSLNLILAKAVLLNENTIKTIALVELASSLKLLVKLNPSTNGRITKIAT
jgi:hypothetical protein